MTRQAPEIVSVSVANGQQAANRPLGIYGSYYKLFRCSDGKLRLNLISEEEYLESKKRPISVDDVSSTTDITPPAPPPVVCRHRHNDRSSSQTTLNSRSPVIPSDASNASAPPPPPSAKRSLHCVPDEHWSQQQQQRMTIKRQRTAAAANEAAHQTASSSSPPSPPSASSSSNNNTKQRAKRGENRVLRSTVAVADLIAEYIPVGVPVVLARSHAAAGAAAPAQLPDSSCETAAASKQRVQPSAHQPGTPAIWNSWIETVGKRFPMADMSIRKVLDTLDRRPDILLNTADD